ncbi:uncharacterized protein LOC131366730 [Hemibagrus wyckioides]|uniref:uncharacterized protein LOC131366730 n=1 Tax=Hemibagrus wyckioides TaxID=337641 RepID=UPI00266C30DF|nr:uncharacterized protein LOC131366730 [Hemibagrus wyckioides]
MTVLKLLRNLSATLSSPSKSSDINTTEMNITTAEYLIEIEIDEVDMTVLMLLRNLSSTFSSPCKNSNIRMTVMNITTAEYLFEIEIDAVDITDLMLLRNLSATISSPIKSSNINMTELNITTVCSLNGTEYWCSCINSHPDDGHFCQPINELTSMYDMEHESDEYMIEIEVVAVDMTVLKLLRNLSATLSSPSKSSDINTTEMNITTAEYLIEIEIDEVDMTVLMLLRNLSSTFSSPCTNSNVNITAMNITTAEYLFEIEIDAVDITDLMLLRNLSAKISSPIKSSNISMTELNITTAEYLIEIEIDEVDMTVLMLLRNLSSTFSSPCKNSNICMTVMNITTVCSLNETEYQCRCEDQYFWPCEKCTLYGSCDDVTNSSCGCITALPNDGHFCQPINELTNISTCPTVTHTVTSSPAEYLIEIEIDEVDMTVLMLLRNLSSTFSSPCTNSNLNITAMNITTVCSLNETEHQCRCEDQYFWPCEKCTLYGSCDDVTNSSCGCVTALPNDGHFCQPINELTTEYLFEIEIDAVDIAALILLRNLSATISSPIKSSNINMTELNITTVCSLNGTEYRCRCEDQYFWPCERCTVYVSCDYVTESSCGCINSLPDDGHFCQPINELTNNSTCPPVTPTDEYMIEIEVVAVDMTVLKLLRNLSATLSSPSTNSNINTTEMNITTAEYLFEIEIDAVDITDLMLLRNLSATISSLSKNSNINMTELNITTAEYLIEIEIDEVDMTVLMLLRNLSSTFSNVNITAMNITTVCSLNETEYQCRCEDQYFWPCEKCTLYGSCNNVTNSSCDCVNNLPNDGHFCQPIAELTSHQALLGDQIIKADKQGGGFMPRVVDRSSQGSCWAQQVQPLLFCRLMEQRREGLQDDQTTTCHCAENERPEGAYPRRPRGQFCVDYMIEIEIGAVDTTVLKQLKNISVTLILPLMHSNINMTKMNITTVCTLNGTEYQCRCEDQYFWPCEKCTLYGSCNNVTNFSCDCINTLPNDGHFCQPINELTILQYYFPLAEYLIEIEIDAVDITELKLLMNRSATLNSPFIYSNINMTEIDITTVCSVNGTEYQCRCEDQFFWPCEKCTLYGSCDDVTNSSCGCINTLPDDGHFCQPNNELTTEYLIEIEINAVDITVLMLLRNLSSIFNLPSKNSNINMTEMYITTVCSLNGTEYQCRCEDQYFWPCEKCTLYGSCDDAINDTCGCINALPNDGHFCRLINELTNNSTFQVVTPTAEYLTEIELDAVDITVLKLLRNLSATLSSPFIHSKISMTEMNITTVCRSNGAAYQCRCEDQYFWPCEKCTVYGSCDDVTKGFCSCINVLSNDGHFCQPINEFTATPTTLTEFVEFTKTSNTNTPTTSTANSTTAAALTATNTSTTYTANTSTSATPSTTTTATTSTSTPSADIHVLNFSLAINEEFDFALTDKHSAKYQAYKTRIESSIDGSYRNVPTYQANSGKVTGFRTGSVIADFSIKTTSDNINLVSVNQQIAVNLRSEGFNVSETAFSQSVKDGLYDSNSYIYPGTNLILICNAPVTDDITWTMNGNKLKPSDKYAINRTGLIVNNVTPIDSGQYACTTTVNSVPYVIWQTIAIQPYPNIQVSSDKVVKCEDSVITLQCCVQGMYAVKWTDTVACSSTSTVPLKGCTFCEYKINNQDCQSTDQVIQVTCQLTSPISGNTAQSYKSKSIKIEVMKRAFTCSDSVFGAGHLGDVHIGDCNGNMVGSQKAVCNSSGLWDTTENNCVLRIIQNLKDEAQNLQVTGIQDFMGNVISNTTEATQSIIASPATILTIVEILTIISNLSQTILINQPVMTNFLKTTDIIGSVGARDMWTRLNKNSTTMNASSELLKSIESIASRLGNENISITTNYTTLSKVNISAPFSETFGINLTTQINLPMIKQPTFITVIISSALENALPVRNLTNNDSSQTGTKINGDVAVIETTSVINNISLSFAIKNETLGNPQCVFWNYSLLNGVGGWDSTGCQLKPLGNKPERYTCECTHTTSFSILMSPFSHENAILDYITYIGVAISMGSLVLCLFIEIIIWKSVTRNDTSCMRHVSIVNIAISLLISNTCFIIGTNGVKKEVDPCSTVTFFMHFFYLALFFWMLLSALLLLYRTLMVFSRMTRAAMMGIGFTVGYGAPLIIAVITVASTAGNKGYIQQDYNCWLNWNQTKALLAFVIPALTIVAINLLVLIVVLCKMLRRGVNASTQPDEKHPLVVIARCVAILTPLFGLTWGFGIGTMVSSNFGIHVVFAFLNSLQGFFILLFGILLDNKVREALAGKLGLKNLSSNHTRRMSARPSSSSGVPFIQRV